jgi:hypothetical protein
MDIIGIILLAFVYLVPSFVAAGRNFRLVDRAGLVVHGGA